jgi:hypothetical protein
MTKTGILALKQIRRNLGKGAGRVEAMHADA